MDYKKLGFLIEIMSGSAIGCGRLIVILWPKDSDSAFEATMTVTRLTHRQMEDILAY